MAEMAEKELSEEELAELRVRCLTMNLHGVEMLLPNTLVAEVTETTEVSSAVNAPDWLNGYVSWRGRNVPLVSFEQLLGVDTGMQRDTGHMAVLNTLNHNPQIPFIAIEIQGLPRLSVLQQGALEYDENEKYAKPVVLSCLRVEGEPVIVPNIDAIEQMLEDLGISA